MVQPHRRPHTALAASQPLLSKYYYSVFLMENLCVRYGNLVFLVVYVFAKVTEAVLLC